MGRVVEKKRSPRTALKLLERHLEERHVQRHAHERPDAYMSPGSPQ